MINGAHANMIKVIMSRPVWEESSVDTQTFNTSNKTSSCRPGLQSPSSFDAFIPPIRLVAPCRAIPLPARFVSGFGERASVPRLGFGLGRIWVLRVSLPLSIYHSCVYLT